MKKILGLFVFATILALPVVAFAADPLPAGFIAVSESKLNWEKANAFCQEKGGRLPLLDGKESLDEAPVKLGIPVEGFGKAGDSWPKGLPAGWYWTGTAVSSAPDKAVWTVGKSPSGDSGVGPKGYKNGYDTKGTACVPVKK